MTIQVRLTETGRMLETVPTSVTIPWRGSYGHFEVPTLDDTVEETASVVTATVIADTGSPYRVETPSFAMWTVLDNDGPGVTVSPLALTVTEGATGTTYAVKLNTQPTGDVTVTPSSSNPAVTVSPATLAFTTSNWATTQTVTVTAAQDADAADDSATIRHAVAGYGSVTAADVSVTVRDDDNGGTDATPPLLTGATVTGSTLVLTYDEALDGASVPPAPGAFVVTAAGNTITVQGVRVAGATVTLTLATAVEVNQAVTVDYTPGTNPIQDEAGIDAVPLSGQTVTNTTGGPGPGPGPEPEPGPGPEPEPEPEPLGVEIVGVPDVAVTGESYELTAQSDEASLVYAWRVAGGTIEPDDAQMVVWTASATADVAWIHVDVTREDGATAGQSAYVRAEVPELEPEPEPEPEPVSALPLLGQLLLALGLLRLGVMRLSRRGAAGP